MKYFNSMTENERLENLIQLNNLCFSSSQDFDLLIEVTNNFTKMVALNLEIKNYDNYENFIYEYIVNCWCYFILTVGKNKFICNYILKELENIEKKWKIGNFKYKNSSLKKFIYDKPFNEFDALNICINKYPFTKEVIKNLPITTDNWWYIGYALFLRMEILFSLFNDPLKAIYGLRIVVPSILEEMKELIDKSDKSIFHEEKKMKN